MKVPISKLVAQRQAIIVSQFVSIPEKEDGEIDGSKDFFNQNASIDFNTMSSAESENTFKISLRFSFNNRDEPLSGYSINVLAEGVFSYEEKNKKLLLKMMNAAHFSGLSMMIAFLREHVRTTTDTMAFGHFVIPPIDLQQLISNKYQN